LANIQAQTDVVVEMVLEAYAVANCPRGSPHSGDSQLGVELSRERIFSGPER